MHDLINFKSFMWLQKYLRSKLSFHAICLRSLLLCETDHECTLLTPLLVGLLQSILEFKCSFRIMIFLFSCCLSYIPPSMRSVLCMQNFACSFLTIFFRVLKLCICLLWVGWDILMWLIRYTYRKIYTEVHGWSSKKYNVETRASV